MIEEQGESFHQDIKTIEKIPGMLEYQHVGRLLLVLKKRLLAAATPEKYRKDNFWIRNRAIFSVMKQEYMLSCLGYSLHFNIVLSPQSLHCQEIISA